MQKLLETNYHVVSMLGKIIVFKCIILYVLSNYFNLTQRNQWYPFLSWKTSKPKLCMSIYKKQSTFKAHLCNTKQIHIKKNIFILTRLKNGLS